MIRIVHKCLGTVLIALSFAAGAHAESVAFRYNDLDLTTDAGKAELEKRIDTVMRQACPGEAITGSRIASDPERTECMADVRRQIMARINSRSGGGSSSR